MKIKQQNGMTGIGWLLVLGLIAFFALAAIRVWPIYVEGFKVRGALESLNNVPNITKMSNVQIVKNLFKTFNVDNVDNVEKEDILITKEDGKLTVAIEYEARGPFMGNLEIIATFNEKVEFIQH